MTSNSAIPRVYKQRKTNWTSVRLLGVYRLGLAASFFAQSFINSSPLVSIVNLTLYSWVSFAFLVLALVWMVAAVIERRGFRNQVSLQIYGDTIIIILLMHACGGISSGLGMLLIISIAITGLLAEKSLAILFASLASLGLLAEHVYSVANIPSYSGTSTQVGILGASLIATAIVTHSLVMRARSSEQLIQQRERDVALLSALNQEIIENMEAGVIVLGRNDHVRHINRAARQLLNLPRDGSISLQRDSSRLQTSLDAWRKANANQSILRPQTTEIDNLQVNFRQLLNEGQPNTMIFLNDVSSIRDSMRQARLASLGHLTASIAHEIRNPLGAISYAAELLDEGERFDEADKRMVDIINQHTRRINHIIEDILNISRGDTTARERIDLSSWLPAFVEEFSLSGLATTDSFEIAIETPTAQLMFDNGHLSQILTNLCTNACVHGDPDKPITLRVFRGPGDALCLEVADQGPGINDEVLEQIFEPFYTTSHQGSGLGLYIVAQLCELNSASISVRINQHNGSSFILRTDSLTQATGNRLNS